MGWDSNPREACTPAGFQDRCLKPLGHPSGSEHQRFGNDRLRRKGRCHWTALWSRPEGLLRQTRGGLTSGGDRRLCWRTGPDLVRRHIGHAAADAGHPIAAARQQLKDRPAQPYALGPPAVSVKHLDRIADPQDPAALSSVVPGRDPFRVASQPDRTVARHRRLGAIAIGVCKG